MGKSIAYIEVSDRVVCIFCGNRIEDGTVREIDRWIVEDDGDVVCPDCQIHEDRAVRYG